MDFVQQQVICRERNLNSQEAKSADLCDSALAGTEISEVLDLHVTSLYIFSDFVQNDKTKYKIEQTLLKTKLNQTDGEGAFPVFREVPKVRWLVDSRASIVT